MRVQYGIYRTQLVLGALCVVRTLQLEMGNNPKLWVRVRFGSIRHGFFIDGIGMTFSGWSSVTA